MYSPAWTSDWSPLRQLKVWLMEVKSPKAAAEVLAAALSPESGAVAAAVHEPKLGCLEQVSACIGKFQAAGCL